jgi:hypothetical protein
MGRCAAWRSCGLLGASLLFVAPDVGAGGTEQDKQIATDLFDRGVKRMNEGRCDDARPTDAAACKEAIDDFRRAYALYPAALGALRNLAYCEKGAGMIASASRDFRDLARKAPLDPKPERRLWADFARKEVEALEPRIPHVVVKVPLDRPKGTKVMLDGAPLAEAGWGTRIDVDPGPHLVEASAPRKQPFKGEVSVGEREDKTVAVAFEDAVEVPVETKPTAPVASTKHDRTLPWLVTAVGVVGVGAGLGLGVAARSKRDDACGDSNVCDGAKLDDARSLASTSTLVTAVGGVVLATGVVWLLLTPSSHDEPTPTRAAQIAPWVSPQGAGFVAVGRF